jgi:hypothetical protein
MTDFAEQLRSVRLKKAIHTKPESDQVCTTNAFLTNAEIKAYQTNVLNCNIENWYELIRGCTFETRFCPIYQHEAELFVNVYERFFKDKDLAAIYMLDWRSALTDEQQNAHNDLETRLKKQIEECIATGGFAFVKTSSRSAKDSPLASKQFKQLYHDYLVHLKAPNENEQIVCLLKAAFECLRIENAHQAIDMFIKSERIYQDMILALDNPTRFNENFVIRKFHDIDVDMEFRGFVYDWKLNALSQYNYLIFSQRIHESQVEIQNRILEFFHNTVLLKLKQGGFSPDFVIDFAILPSKRTKAFFYS